MNILHAKKERIHFSQYIVKEIIYSSLNITFIHAEHTHYVNNHNFHINYFISMISKNIYIIMANFEPVFLLLHLNDNISCDDLTSASFPV